jgi:hypothetical protein
MLKAFSISNGMKFKVPKFLERETKFFNFLTFKQLAYTGVIGIFLFVLYYIVPRTTFFFLVFILGGGSLALIIITVEGIPLYQLTIHLLNYLFSSRKFIWARKEKPLISLLRKERVEKKEKKEEAPLRIFPESKLGKLSSQIERGTT